jgi:photosystem II stability/assembly factor-like uncharacterized protein
MYKKLLALLPIIFLLFSTITFGGWDPDTAVTSLPNYSIISIAAVDENVVWAIADTMYWAGPANFTPIFMRTTNSGKTWKVDTIPDVKNTFLFDITALDSNTASVIAMSGQSEGPEGIYKTIDGGTSWTK